MNHHLKSPIADIRREYILQSLTEEDTADNPFDQFTKWWQEASNSEIDEVNAMTLATATKEGIPTARVVLLKGYNETGFIFFTNYNSRKGRDLAENPHASLNFFWKELERQVRIDGLIEKIAPEESDVYFASRPAGSRLGAWSSPQSSVIENRKIIEDNFLKYEEKFGTGTIPRPGYWGGYLVKPVNVEFWQGRSSRLHDRIQYTLQNNNQWKRERLAP
jgi:pyridoxamine 5'-phosphate oxidase